MDQYNLMEGWMEDELERMDWTNGLFVDPVWRVDG